MLRRTFQVHILLPRFVLLCAMLGNNGFIMLLIFIVSIIAIIVGTLGGLTGTGGVLIPPALIEIVGMDTHLALGTAQASFIIPAVLGVWMFSHKGQLDWIISTSISMGGLIFSYIGANLKSTMSASSLSILLALCILVAGWMLIRPLRVQKQLLPSKALWRAGLLFSLGSAVGLLAGITGSGSTAILVPAMLYAGISPLVTLATCQFYSVCVASAGTVGNSLHNAVELSTALWLSAGQVLGTYIGITLAQRIQNAQLRKIVAIVCLLTGAGILLKALYSLY